MALITRLSRLFRADMHAVLDRMEEPDILLRQAVREMEEEVANDARQQKIVGQQREQIRARIAELDSGLEAIVEELDLCFEAGNSELARTLLRRRLEGERLRKRLAQASKALETQYVELERALEDRRRRLETMRQKAALFDNAPAGRDGDSAWSSDDLDVTDADIELAFLREQQRRSS